MCVCVHARVRVRARVRAYVHACMHAFKKRKRKVCLCVGRKDQRGERVYMCKRKRGIEKAG